MTLYSIPYLNGCSEGFMIYDLSNLLCKHILDRNEIICQLRLHQGNAH